MRNKETNHRIQKNIVRHITEILTNQRLKIFQKKNPLNKQYSKKNYLTISSTQNEE